MFADTFFPPSPSSTYEQPAEALKRVFPLPLYVVVQNASAIEQNAHFKMWIAGGKKAMSTLCERTLSCCLF